MAFFKKNFLETVLRLQAMVLSRMIYTKDHHIALPGLSHGNTVLLIPKCDGQDITGFSDRAAQPAHARKLGQETLPPQVFMEPVRLVIRFIWKGQDVPATHWFYV